MDWLDMIKYLEDIRRFSKNMFKKKDEQHVLSRDELDLLSLLVIYEDITSLKLSQKMQVSKAFISRLIDQLLQKEMISKRKHPSDKRSYYIDISDKGRMCLNQFYSYYLEPIYSLYKNFTPDEFKQFITLIHKANVILRKDD